MKKFNFIKNLFVNHLVNYPTPVNLNYFWGFGFCSGVFLTLQIVTGVILAMHYCSAVELAFESVEHIMRDVNYGWFLRYLHSNGASFFFICLYIHVFKNVYYRSYKFPRQHVWNSGILILFLSMATAFIGYVLPWGQMSFRGATVITNLLTALPVVGTDAVHWLWGGFSVGNATLNRFFSLHYILPFIMMIAILLHLALLHEIGSNNPLGVDSIYDRVNFYPYFLIKDFFTFVCIFIIYIFVVCFYPDILGHADNYLKANPLVTPAHIVPEWYFSPFHAIPRSVPSKLGGVICMFSSIAVLFSLPFIDRSSIAISPRFSFFFKFIFWFFVFDCFLLGLLGAMPVEEPFITASRVVTVFYFLFFILVFVLTQFENKLILDFLKTYRENKRRNLW